MARGRWRWWRSAAPGAARARGLGRPKRAAETGERGGGMFFVFLDASKLALGGRGGGGIFLCWFFGGGAGRGLTNFDKKN